MLTAHQYVNNFVSEEVLLPLGDDGEAVPVRVVRNMDSNGMGEIVLSINRRTVFQFPVGKDTSDESVQAMQTLARMIGDVAGVNMDIKTC